MAPPRWLTGRVPRTSGQRSTADAGASSALRFDSSTDDGGRCPAAPARGGRQRPDLRTLLTGVPVRAVGHRPSSLRPLAVLLVGAPEDGRRRSVFRKHLVVRDGRRAVVRYDGRVVDVLDVGRHRLVGRAWRRSVEVLDVRQQLLVLTGQEVAAADVPGVRVSAAARFAIADPVAFLDAAADPELRLAVQLAVRDWVAAAPVAELSARRAGAAVLLTPLVAAEVAHLGIGVVEVSVRDVSLPGELRRALLATATSTQEGQAALERARGEVAATRALANAARTLADDPALLQLRTVQEVARAGATVVLHVGEP